MDDRMQEELALSKAEAARIDALVAKTAEMINSEMANLCRQMPFGVSAEWALMLLGDELAAQRRATEIDALRLGLSRSDVSAIPLRKYSTPKIRGHLRLVSSVSSEKPESGNNTVAPIVP